MSQSVITLIVFILTLAMSLVCVAGSIQLFTRLGLLDHPGENRVGRRSVPRGVGVAMYVAFLLGVGITYVFPVSRFPIETERILLMAIALTIVTAVMLVDDAIDLSPLAKLLWQVLAAAIIVLPYLRGESHGIVISQINLPFIGTVVFPLMFAVVGTLVWLVGMMNVMNWIDGLDGLAASITLVACTVLFVHTYWAPGVEQQFSISLLPLVLAAAVIGFLPSNWHPAKAIMGDAGAMFLGLALGVISIIGGAKIATALLVLGLPILDGLWVTMYRIVNRKSPAERDMAHLHHRLLRAGFSQPQVVLIMSAVSTVAGAMSLLLPTRELKFASLIGLGMLLAAGIWWLARHPNRKMTTEHPG